MPTDTDPGVRALDAPCWTILTADGEGAGFEGSELHYLTEAEAREAAPSYQPEDEPPVQVVQLPTCCWTATLLCGKAYVDERGDFPAVHFADEADVLTSIGEEGLYPAQPGVFACGETGCETCAPYEQLRFVRMVGTKMVELGELALRFSRVQRVTFHPDGVRPETDSDHTVMLGLVACALAADYFPQLNTGLVAQFALAHDLPEAGAGDVSTLRQLSEEQLREKKNRERSETFKIHARFAGSLPWVARTIRWYELQHSPEAVFVWAVDKLLPKVCHILNGGATVRAENATVDELRDRYATQNAQIRERAAQFPILADLHTMLVDRMLAAVEEGPFCPVVQESCPGTERGASCTRPCFPEGGDR